MVFSQVLVVDYLRRIVQDYEASAGGFLFENNNSESLNKAFDKFINSSEEELFQKRLVAKKQVKKFTFFPHFQNFIKVLK